MRESVDDQYHFPRQRNGCYYERVEDCCPLCLVRLTIGGIRAGIARTDREKGSESDLTESRGTLIRDSGE